jgi:helix-turn-helix protein
VTDEHGVRHLYTATEAERILRIKASTVRSWARRKRIYPYGLDEHRHPMFDRDDLLAARSRTRTADETAKAKRRARNTAARNT